MRPKILFLWITPAVLAAFVVGLLAAERIRARESDIYWDESTVEKVRALVNSQYVDEITEERAREIFYGAMEGYLSSLDPYCSFYDPEERMKMEEDTSGRFGGVGVIVNTHLLGLMIVGLRRGDPAHQAGAKLGDIVTGVDGESVAKMALEEITALIKGPPGSKVELQILRGEQRLDLSMARSAIRIDSVVGVRMVDPRAGIGYFRVASFKESTGEDAKKALEFLRARGARSFVLDLRQNGGGVLDRGAVALVDLFLSDGPIVQMRGRTQDSKRIYYAREETTVCPNAPLAVLVDGGSASAAEVVAGAFQDRRRGVLVGARTYGKFLVQSIHRIPDSDMALSITTAKYATPYGRWLQRKLDRDGHVVVRGGLLPDVQVSRSKEESERLLESYFPLQRGIDMLTLDEIAPSVDSQLDRAVRLLAGYYAVTGD